ncbi:MAG: sugar transferase [Ktedonobacterales bacterium]
MPEYPTVQTAISGHPTGEVAAAPHDGILPAHTPAHTEEQACRGVPPRWAASVAAIQTSLAPRNAVAKRALDIVVAVLVLLLTLPFYPFILLAIRLDSEGPALFRQVRAGQDGRLFAVYKFRSMYYSSQAIDPLYEQIAMSWLRGVPFTADLHDVDSHAHHPGTETGPFTELEGPHAMSAHSFVAAPRTPHTKYKLKDDPRITRVGRILRATSIDELPQFLNVLRGDMSIVGPRPAIPYEVERYFPQDFGRLLVKPGITGLWQVKGRGHVSFRQMIEMDMEYVANNSFWQDVGLILRTIPAVLLARGAA